MNIKLVDDNNNILN